VSGNEIDGGFNIESEIMALITSYNGWEDKVVNGVIAGGGNHDKSYVVFLKEYAYTLQDRRREHHRGRFDKLGDHALFPSVLLQTVLRTADFRGYILLFLCAQKCYT
jgi:hypothetical protein